MMPGVNYVIYGFSSKRTTPGVSPYRSLTLEEIYSCSYYLTYGDRWQLEKANWKSNFVYL